MASELGTDRLLLRAFGGSVETDATGDVVVGVDAVEELEPQPTSTTAAADAATTRRDLMPGIRTGIDNIHRAVEIL